MLQGRPPETAVPSTAVDDEATDAELAHRASGGELAAFEELYRRHVDAAWRVALAVAGNPHDAADAVSDAFTRVFQALPERLHDGDYFRPYLLATARNAAIDGLRRSGRQCPTNAADELDGPTLGLEPSEMVLASADSTMVSRAFHSLPERWRSVLWLTEVEGIPAREAALLLGLSPNGVAQLAVRARAGLRQRYLQAHLGASPVRAGCRYTVDHLGAYVAGGLAPRDISKVDQHLAGCEACRSRVTELEDMGVSLRRIALPLPVGLAAATLGKWRLAPTAGAAAKAAATPAGLGGGAGGVAAVVAAPAPFVASVASVALFVASVVGVGVVHRGQRDRHADPAAVVVAAPGASFSPASAPDGAAPASVEDDPIAGLVPEHARGRSGLAPLEAPDTAALPDDPSVPGTPDPNGLLALLGQAELALPFGPLGVLLDLAGGCAGIQVGPLVLGCEAPAPPGLPEPERPPVAGTAPEAPGADGEPDTTPGQGIAGLEGPERARTPIPWVSGSYARVE